MNNIISKTRKRLDDETYWSRDMARCYLYSKKDELIQWDDVEDHANAAAERDVAVWMVCFESTGHCKHMDEDIEQYWSGVVEAWEEGYSEMIDRERKGRTRLSRIWVGDDGRVMQAQKYDDDMNGKEKSVGQGFILQI